MSKFVASIEKIGEDFQREELTGNLRKVDPNESGSLDRFSFVRWYVLHAGTEHAEHIWIIITSVQEVDNVIPDWVQ